MMFEAGKPVLCEKPLTCCAADTCALIKAAKEKGVFLMEVSSYAAINCVPHYPHYGKGWGMVGDWEI